MTNREPSDDLALSRAEQAMVDAQAAADTAIRQLRKAAEEVERLVEENRELLAALKDLRAVVLQWCPSKYESRDGKRADAAIDKAERR